MNIPSKNIHYSLKFPLNIPLKKLYKIIKISLIYKKII